ncbi:hypothetical protein [Rhodoferax aquaticus]|uniref:hypothetical protein n=1 Tax=Rhodoferax aquaticus TaxID=2527691 RepID=UPI00143CCBEB|nr:hypothetical protein [Rhodoferax aquaticus]
MRNALIHKTPAWLWALSACALLSTLTLLGASMFTLLVCAKATLTLALWVWRTA